jgi:hypothetical protein
MADQMIVYKDDIKQEGFLTKESLIFKNWRRRWFVLTDKYLCSFKDESDYRNPTEYLKLSEVCSVKTADKYTGKDNSFYVQTPSRMFWLVAETFAEHQSWISAVTNCCLPALICNSIDLGVRHRLTFFTIREDAPETEKFGKCVATQTDSFDENENERYPNDAVLDLLETSFVF